MGNKSPGIYFLESHWLEITKVKHHNIIVAAKEQANKNYTGRSRGV